MPVQHEIRKNRKNNRQTVTKLHKDFEELITKYQLKSKQEELILASLAKNTNTCNSGVTETGRCVCSAVQCLISNEKH